MRAVVLTNQQSNQNALVSKLARHVQIVAVVHSRNIPKKKPTMRKRFGAFRGKVAVRACGGRLLDAWKDMLRRYEAGYEPFRAAPVLEVDNVNDERTFEMIDEARPELVIVSGTNIVGRKLISHSQKYGSILNLHTGISPYVKGGPNCTNWCLAKGWFHLIGNTVMWLDAGVDSGELIATERTPLDGSESLADLHWKVMEHAHDMYVHTAARLKGGASVPRVPQYEVAEGIEFKSADWTGMKIKLAVRNFDRGYRRYFENVCQNADAEAVKLFPLDRG
jgi:methionyl-tRNA formyltransferase